MVDRQARDAAAQVLRAFMDGTISNCKYDHDFPKSEADAALRNIWVNLWFTYSDVREHTLEGKHALTPEARAVYERCLLFLKNDLEFEWPPSEFKLRYGLLRLLGFGRALKQKEEADMSVGEKDFWPFLKKVDYERALRGG
jgi:hypothetical protein